MGKREINLSWGNPYFLLEILKNMYQPPLTPVNVGGLSYPPKDGLPELKELTKKVIKKNTGLDFKHILITNGATSALNTILRFEKPDKVHTGEYGYPLYDRIIEDNGMRRIKDLHHTGLSTSYMRLIDSPSNPEGIQMAAGNKKTDIWDAVYHNKVYTDDLKTFPNEFKYLVGSYSKMLGVAGCRVGYIATNNMFLNKLLHQQNWKDLAGVSTLSQNLIIHLLKNLDLDRFMNRGSLYLCYAREEFQKIEYLFDGQPVNQKGMFYCAKTTAKMMDFFTDCGIVYTELDQNTMRLSMGNTLKNTKEAINRVLKKDGKK